MFANDRQAGGGLAGVGTAPMAEGTAAVGEAAGVGSEVLWDLPKLLTPDLRRALRLSPGKTQRLADLERKEQSKQFCAQVKSLTPKKQELLALLLS